MSSFQDRMSSRSSRPAAEAAGRMTLPRSALQGGCVTGVYRQSAVLKLPVMRRHALKTYNIEDLMVPLSEYATVTVGATLREAVLALEKAQEVFDRARYRHRAILVLDKTGEVVGKISQHTALKALEPQYLKMASSPSAIHYGFSASFLRDLQEQYSLLDGALENICQKAAKMKVEDFNRTLRWTRPSICWSWGIINRCW
jgi:hypothetical protein